jgi:hypothetical protein
VGTLLNVTDYRRLTGWLPAFGPSLGTFRGDKCPTTFRIPLLTRSYCQIQTKVMAMEGMLEGEARQARAKAVISLRYHLYERTDVRLPLRGSR